MHCYVFRSLIKLTKEKKKEKKREKKKEKEKEEEKKMKKKKLIPRRNGVLWQKKMF